MPPRSFVSSVYWASPCESRSRSFESTPCRKAWASSPATCSCPMCETSNRPAAVRTARTSSITPAYCTGISQPAKGTRRPPDSAWRAYSGVRCSSSGTAADYTRADLRGGDEADLVCERVGGARLVLAHGADRAEECELVAQMGAHHLRAVRRDGHAHARVEERAEDRAHRVGVGERAGEQVRGRAHLEHDARRGQQRGQLGVARSEDAVPDAVGPERLDHLADLLGEALLAAVHRHAQAGLARLLHERRERRIGEAPTARAAGPRCRCRRLRARRSGRPSRR